MIKEMASLPPYSELSVGKNRTNTTPNINLLFIFPSKPSIILRISAMRLPSGLA